MGHRDRTFVSYAAEDASAWWEMRAWPQEQGISFDFEDAYDLHAKGDTNRDVIRRRLRERIGRSRQAVVLVGNRSRAVADNERNYFFYELDVLTKLGLPIVVVNLNGVRRVDRAHLPQPLAGRYTINVAFEPQIVRHALDTFVAGYAAAKATQTGPHVYEEHVYAELGI
jgi:hypothetical protein